VTFSLKRDEVHGLSRVAGHRTDASPHRENGTVFAGVDSLALEHAPGCHICVQPLQNKRISCGILQEAGRLS